MAKTLFHSSEKSNFILNMTEEQFSKLASRGLAIAMMMAPLFTLVPEISYSTSDFSEGYISNYTFSAGGLVLGGVIAMIITIIGLMKKYISKWNIFPVCAMAAMVLWGVVSLVKGVDLSISFYGYPNRGEGLLAIIFYFCFFAAAASLKRETALKTIADGAVGVGVLNSAVSLIQIFTGELSHYKSSTLGEEIYAASGLSMSPLFLAMALSLALTAAFVGFITSESKARRIILFCSAVLISFVMMFTYSLIGICGFVLAVIIAVIAVFVLKAPKKRLVCLPASIAAAGAAIALVFGGVIGNINSYRLYDGKLLWWCDSYMRACASGSYDSSKVDIDDTLDVYSYLNSRTMDIIENNALVGTGPDQLAFALINTSAEIDPNMSIPDFMTSEVNRGTFDKVYNEYLYTAATRGVPSLIALILVIVSAVVLGIKSYRRRKTAEAFTISALTIAGVLIFFIGCSSITFAPVFWTAAGAACAGIVTDKEKKAQKKLAKKK
ncbi:O-Antigen ligase [Ruminococcus flavefaciens]|uniref:O-Antigen ligase n=1 Tax=Ruminococcus flavefaciens TaxID=1265 RepID=A0A1H6K7L2_RUMFL|nr:O-antigen ligase family protein [Ruminococcus flavefaciens]SEH69008.1 O-Antigen ligase [Ruminococcus flavefaciens]